MHHTAIGAVAYWSALVRFKKPVGREAALTQGYGKNPVNWSRMGPKFGWYRKVNQKSGWFTNILFHSCVNRKGRSSSDPLSGPVGFLQVHASAFRLLSWLASPSILEKLSFLADVFLFLETSFQILISVSPKTLFSDCITNDHNLSPFRRWSMNVVNSVGELPNVRHTGMCHRHATDQGRFFTSKNPEQAPNLLQNRPYFLKFYSKTGSFFDNLVSNAPGQISKIPVAFLKVIGPIPIFFLKSMPIF